MKYKKLLSFTIILILIGISGYVIYQRYTRNGPEKLFSTQRVEKRTIVDVIRATGYLKVHDLMKIGSLVAGIIHKMHVEENELIKKEQILVEIDDGKDDFEIKEARANLEQAKSILTYQRAFYQRQKILHIKKHISKDRFEQVTQDLQIAQTNVNRTQATYNRVKLNYDNKWIKSPDDGLVIGKIGAEGETVTLSSPPTIIYTIAKDLTKMKAKVKIDESVVGNLKVGMQAELTFDTYPNRLFTGTITDISNFAIIEGGAAVYLATIPIDNSQRLFRPNMNLDASIVIAKKEQVIAVPGHIFVLSRMLLKQIAGALRYSFAEIDPERREELRKKGYKTVWIKKERAFIEKAIQVGISDMAYFEVISGLDGSEELIVDIAEPDVMEEFFKRYFGRGLQ